MVLELIGEETPLESEEDITRKRRRTYTTGTYTTRKENSMRAIVTEGTTGVTGWIRTVAKGLGDAYKLVGFEVDVTILHEGPTTNTVSWTVENTHTTETLESYSRDFDNGDFFSKTFPYPLEKVKPGQQIKLTVGTDGIGTETGSIFFGYFELKVKTVLIKKVL